MHFFSIPADFRVESIDQISRLNEKYADKAKIKEVYGQITIGNLAGSGRANDLLPQVDFSLLEKHIKKLNEQNISFNYTFNATCMGNQEFDADFGRQLKHFFLQLDNLGIDYMTIGLPSILSIVKQERYRFKIKASTVCQINNAEKAMAYKRLGVDTIVLDESINRDFGVLRDIRAAFGQQVELIVNVICHKNCIYEMFHHNQTSHDSSCNHEQKSISFYSHRCMLQRTENPANLLRLAWIRPEDLIHYSAIGYNLFKIQGRQAAQKGDMLKTAEAYMDGKYDGNLMLLLDCYQPTNSFIVDLDNRKLEAYLRPFYQHDKFCRNYCDLCGYCEKYYQKHIKCDDIEEKFALANDFYQELDTAE